MKKEKTIYDLGLHESIQLNDQKYSDIMRVPGGWIYQFITGIEERGYPKSVAVSAVFVPLHNEFNPVFRPQANEL